MPNSGDVAKRRLSRAVRMLDIVEGDVPSPLLLCNFVDDMLDMVCPGGLIPLPTAQLNTDIVTQYREDSDMAVASLRAVASRPNPYDQTKVDSFFDIFTELQVAAAEQADCLDTLREIHMIMSTSSSSSSPPTTDGQVLRATDLDSDGLLDVASRVFPVRGGGSGGGSTTGTIRQGAPHSFAWDVAETNDMHLNDSDKGCFVKSTHGVGLRAYAITCTPTRMPIGRIAVVNSATGAPASHYDETLWWLEIVLLRMHKPMHVSLQRDPITRQLVPMIRESPTRISIVSEARKTFKECRQKEYSGHVTLMK